MAVQVFQFVSDCLVAYVGCKCAEVFHSGQTAFLAPVVVQWKSVVSSSLKIERREIQSDLVSHFCINFQHTFKAGAG